MIKDIDLDKAIRGCCPKCGGSNLKNNGYFKIEAIAWKAQIWMIDGVITFRFEDATTLDKIFQENYNSEFLNKEYFEPDDFGWECEDCHHSFRTGESKAAIMGSPLDKMTQGVIE